MSTKSPRVDLYISGKSGFAVPILNKLREIVHRAAPEITEDIKWGMPGKPRNWKYLPKKPAAK